MLRLYNTFQIGNSYTKIRVLRDDISIRYFRQLFLKQRAIIAIHIRAVSVRCSMCIHKYREVNVDSISMHRCNNTIRCN